MAAHAEHWDWERLSANPSLPWSAELIAPYAERWNWATLSAQRSLPWGTGFYRQFGAHWFAPLVAAQQGLNIHHLGADEITTLLQEKPAQKPD